MSGSDRPSSDLFNRIATEFFDVEEIHREVELHRQHERPDLQAPFSPPRTPLETALAGVWAELLGVERAGVDDNFFDLGGSSIVGAQLLSRIYERLGIELPLRVLFESPPTIAGLAEIIESLPGNRSHGSGMGNPTDEPQGVLNGSARRLGEIEAIPLLSRAGAPVAFPLSYAQQRLWFLHHLDPNSDAYNSIFAFRIRGRLHRAAIEQALSEIVRRHETLRTAFRIIDGESAQVIIPNVRVSLPEIDLSELPERDRHAVRASSMESAYGRPYLLDQGGLLRQQLLRGPEQEITLVIGAHHIVFDGWSLAVFARELAPLYDAFRTGQASPLPELKVQYADFTAWQRNRLEPTLIENQLGYWKQQLEGLSALALPTDKKRPSVRTYRGARQSLLLAADIAASLKELSRRESTTLFMTLLTGFCGLLHRYSGQDDIAIGSGLANRPRIEAEKLIGFFVNTLALRLDLAGLPTVREALGRARRIALAAFDNQDLPFERLVDELAPERDLSVAPLFQVMFMLQNTPSSPFRLPGLEVEDIPFDTGSVKFDMVLSVAGSGECLLAMIEYSTDLFERASITRMLGHLRALIDGMCSQPDAKVSELPILASTERQQLLIDWQDTKARYSLDLCMHEMVVRQVEQTPDAIAVSFESEFLTYREMNARANQLAHYLRKKDVRSEKLAGICVDRSIEMILAVLGVLKSGAAYTPLDPDYPADRINSMLENAGASIVLTVERLGSVLLGCEAETIHLDRDWIDIALESEEDPPVDGDPQNLAYVIHTSGSTGRPKGVMISHRAMNNLVLWMQERFGINGSDRLLQKTPFSFDPSVWEFFWPLVTGAELVIARPHGHMDSNYMACLVAERAITILQLVPLMLQMLVDEPGFSNCESLRLVYCGAEALSANLIDKFYARSKSRLNNVYGPTEAAMHVTLWPCEMRPERRVSIGRGAGNVQTCIVSCQMETMPFGVPGELHIGGAQLARGYMSAPDITADRFIPGRFAAEPGARLYKTGDLARYLDDGGIEFLGRIDNQVKIRGFRIEPGEIEAVIRQHLGIKEVVVLATTDAANKRLVAYMVATSDAQPSATELRDFVRAKLPGYMVPSIFVPMDSLPLTLTGKLDRGRLPAPEMAGLEAAEILEGPRNDIEERLATIWSEVLGVPAIGINDNFFDLGGHSLLAIQLMSRVRESFHTDLPISRLFESPTLARLALAIVRQKASQTAAADYSGSSILPFIAPSPDERLLPFPLTDVQQAYWIGRSGSYELSNVSAHSYIEIESDTLDLERLSLAWQLLVDRHDMLRAIILPDGQQQALAQVPRYRIEVLDLSAESGESIASHMDAIRERMSHQVLRSDQWPIFEIRATLFSRNRVRIHISLDALLLDGWSVAILRRELVRLYFDPHARLPHLKLSFRDYVIAAEALKESEIYKQSLDYWLSLLPGMPPAPELPLTVNPGSIRRPEFKRRRARLEPAAWLRIKSRAAQAGLTGSGVLCAAYSEIIAAWSKSPRFTINLTLFNRPPMHSQINDIVGDFTSLTLLAVDLSADDSFEARAQRLQHRLWNDLDHRYVGGVRLMRELARTRREAAGVAFPIVFTSVLTLPSDEREVKALSLPVEAIYSISQTPQVWLDHIVSEAQGSLNLIWDAVDGLFPPGVLDCMFAAYCSFLERLSDDERAWQEPPRQLLRAAQIQQRDAINATEAPAHKGLLHTLFVKQARLRPFQAAVICSSRSLSYEELLSRSTGYARRLRESGARPNMLVAIVMEKGWEQVVAALAVLQSGAAYLPIDAGLPAERLWRLLHDGEVTLVLTQPWLDRSLEWPATVRRICLDDEGPGDSNNHELEAAQSEQDLAYVIYTSGSTGQPKGVMIDHRGAVNTILDINQRFGVRADDRVLAVSSLGFDLSVFDIFGTLAAGGTIIIPDAWAARDPRRWAELISQNQVTIWNSVPALMEMLVDSQAGPGEQLLGSLRLVLLSGDWIPVSLPDRIKALVNEVRIVSLGGATEASIWSIIYEIEELDPEWKSIPYGKPMVNQSFHVFNSRMEPCPVWVIGELYIGGLGLAQGYWRDAAKTDAKFITHPRTKERLYRTGDLGRYLPDGNVEFLGREDFQVKIRGHRIELGEIEAAVTQHPSVKEGIVMAREDGHRGKRLVAYVVPQEGFMPAVGELGSFVEKKLPEFMVPSAFVILKELPLTANGKLDRQALVGATDAAQEPEHAFAPARTEIERKLAVAWREVFGRDAVGIYDNFFELGGDSILAIKVISKARQAGLILTPRDLFERQTIAALAQVVAGKDAKLVQESHAVSDPVAFGWSQADLGSIAAAINESLGEESELISENVEDFYPLSPMQEGILFHTIYRSEPDLYVFQFSALLRGEFDVRAFELAWQRVVDRHAILRTSFIWENLSKPVQVVHKRGEAPLLKYDWRGMAGAEQQQRLEKFLKADREQGFLISKPPLMRASLIRMDDRLYHFSWSHHHLLLDGWSITLVFNEVLKFYDAFRSGHDLQITAPRPYRDYIMWLHQQDMLGAELFWRGRLKGFATPTPLAMGLHPGGFRDRGKEYGESQIQLSIEATEALQSLAQRYHLTVNILAQGVWALLLSRYSGEQEVMFGVVVSGRPAALAGVTSMVGLFINTLPMRVTASPDDSILTWLKRLQSDEAEMLEFQYSPLSQIQSFSEVPRGVQMFDSILSFDNYPLEVSLPQSVGNLEVFNNRSIQKSNYPLAIVAVPGRALSIRVSCDHGRFESPVIELLLDRYKQFLLTLTERAEQGRLSELQIVSGKQKALFQQQTKIDDLDDDFSF
jgi:amino acid adenylation domain-containing protein